jgi:release factor glutamine methyltransferase
VSGRAPAPTLAAALAEAERYVGDRAEARRLAGLALGRPASWILAHPEAILSDDAHARLRDLAARRADGVPFAYLAGEREFYGYSFTVDPAVLIPRPETEHVVEWALSLDLPETADVVDIGTGSGCIALSLAAERPGWNVTGTDVSTEALSVAARNRWLLGLARVDLLPGDLLDAVGDRRFDLIVSNPPYVAADDHHLRSGDVRFEPKVALTAGPDGLSVIRELVAGAPACLEPGGWLLVEHGHDQAEAVRTLLSDAGYEAVETRRDLAGIERVTGGCRAGSAVRAPRR